MCQSSAADPGLTPIMGPFAACHSPTNLPILLVARSAFLDRGRQIWGLLWSAVFPPRRVHLFVYAIQKTRRKCAGLCVRWTEVSMTCNVVQPTAEEF